jgi:hypothetical protein
MTKTIQFFVTKSDLEGLFTAIEKPMPLIFVQAGRFDSLSPSIFRSISELPGLGKASANSSTNCRSYLVGESNLEIHARRLSSAPFFAFDQLENPKTVVCNPGGIWEDRMLIRGNFGTASNEAASAKLMRILSANIKNNFANIRGIFVGSEAKNLWKQGFRLTGAEQSSVQFDLAP